MEEKLDTTAEEVHTFRRTVKTGRGGENAGCPALLGLDDAEYYSNSAETPPIGCRKPYGAQRKQLVHLPSHKRTH